MKANSVSGNRKNSFDSLIILAANEVNDSSTSRQRCMDFKKLHDDAKIYDNLQKAILVCDSIDNGLMRNELKNLIEQSIELFKMYHHKDGDSRQLSPLSPESPTSSMNPQLGIVDKVVNVAPQINQDCFIAPEMSMISLDTEENLDVRQSCLTMSPLRRFGIQLSQMLCSFGPYGKASDTPTIISPVPNYDAPMSPSLQYFISQHREAPPTLPLERFDFEEICRSTDADCDENEVRNLTTDDVVIKSSNQEDGEIMCAEISIDDNKQRLTEQRQLKRQQEIAKLRSLASSRIACEPNVNCQVSFRLRNASRANKVLLLETATVIGLSLCKAFLIWRNAMLQYRKFRDSLLNRFSTEEIASVRRSQSNFESIPLQDPTMAILTEQKRLVGRRYDDASGSNSGYDCDSNNSSNCDSNTSYVSDEIANCERPNDGITSDDDRVGCRDLIDDANDALLLTNRHSEDVAKSKSSRKSRSKLASARMQGGGTSNASLKMSSYVDKGGLSGTQSPWLHCLNSTDDKEFMESDGTSSRFEYEEVFGCKVEQESLGKKSVTNEQQRSRLQNRVSNCITPISVNDSNSDSDSDAELESRKTSRSRCFQMSSTSFEQTNPISKIFQPEKKARSVSFDGRCLPMPQLFDRRGRSQSVSQVHQSRKSSDISEAVLQENSDDGGCSQSSCPAKTIPQPQNTEELDVTQQSIASTPYTFSNAFDYTRCVGFNAISFNSADKFLSTESPRTPKSLFDSSGELQLRDCYGNAREALVLHSHIVARQDQYNAIAPVIRSNELAMWAIFAQYPMTCCDVRLDLTSSALAVHNYNSSRPLLSFACLRSLLSSFGVCPAICSESELSEHLKEIKVATSPPSSPFFAASPIKVCSFESFVKILWLVASERMLMTAARAPEGEPSILQAQVRFAMLLHQMDISDGRAKLTQCLMSSSNKSGGSKDIYPEGECLSPLSPVCRAFMEPVLPLPAFDLSVLKVARVGMAARKMMVYDTTNKAKIRKKMVVKSSAVDEKAIKFAREVTSGIATENSSEDLSDF